MSSGKSSAEVATWFSNKQCDDLLNPCQLSIVDDHLFVCCYMGMCLLDVSITTKNFVRLIGDPQSRGFAGDHTRLGAPTNFCITSNGTIYISDAGNHVISKLLNEKLELFAGNGSPGYQVNCAASKAQFNRPHAIVLDHSESNIFLCDMENMRIDVISLFGDNHVITYNMRHLGSQEFLIGCKPISCAFPSKRSSWKATDLHPNLYIGTWSAIFQMNVTDGTFEYMCGNTTKSGNVDGPCLPEPSNPSAQALFSGIYCILFHPSKDDVMFIADNGNNKIRKIENNVVSTIAGSGKIGSVDGPALESQFNSPRWMCWYGEYDMLVCDYISNSIRKITGVLNSQPAGEESNSNESSSFPSLDKHSSYYEVIVPRIQR